MSVGHPRRGTGRREEGGVWANLGGQLSAFPKGEMIPRYSPPFQAGGGGGGRRPSNQITPLDLSLERGEVKSLIQVMLPFSEGDGG